MRVAVIGDRGILGSAVVAALEAAGHESLGLSRRSSPPVDVRDARSVTAALEALRPLDAVVCTAANAPLRDAGNVAFEELAADIAGKLAGQLWLCFSAARLLEPNGSITLTSGAIPSLPGAAVGAAINVALETFTERVAAELPRGVRVNVIRPGWVAETLRAMGADPAAGIPAADVAREYLRCVEGTFTGRVVPASKR